MRRSGFQMKTPILKSVSMKVNDDFIPSESDIELALSDEKFIDKISETNAIVTYSIKVFNEEFTEKIPFYMEVSYSAEFLWSEINGDDLDALLNQNAPAILLGYIRPIILELSTNSGFPPLHLPLMNFQM